VVAEWVDPMGYILTCVNGIHKQLGDTWNVLCDRMKNALSGMCRSVVGPSRPRKSGMICALLNLNVVESNCVRK